VNVKEYIASGIIESYVLGIATEQERLEFEALCTTHPEIAEARNAFELALEQQLLGDSRQAPAALKGQINDRLLQLTQSPTGDDGEQERTPVRRINAWKWVAAASLILLAGSIYWGYTNQSKVQQLQAENSSLKSQGNQSSTEYARLQQEMDMARKPGMKLAALKGTSHAPGAMATIYWDTASASRDVYLMVNNLPQPATDRQYQLWALLNGQPIDLGVLDMNIPQQHLLIKMQHVDQAQAFAITLEPKGGSAQPSMDSMFVMGNL
jgi:anti-sigma-K factor RskA